MATFKINQAYKYTFIGDRSIVCEITVTKKTATMITFIDNGETKRAKIQVNSEGNEFIYPDGKYSKCPICKSI
jgi:hypothetical protein